MDTSKYITLPEQVEQVEEVEPEATGEYTTSSEATPIPSAQDLQALCADIKANYDFNVDVKPAQFNFKTRKDKETGVETKKDSIELAIPYPSVDGIVAILETDGKGLQLLIDSMEDVVNAQARNILLSDDKINAHNMPVEKLSWEFIANIPKAERTGGGIPKEVWEGFAEDYVAVMQVAAGKTAKQAVRAAGILKNKFSNVKTNKPVIDMLAGQLAIYAENSSKITEYVKCVEFLVSKADDLLNVTEEELLANL